MQTWIGVGLSKNTNSFQAGREAAILSQQEAKQELLDLVIVFASAKFNQEEMLKGVRSVTGETPLVGCSSAGQITTRGPDKNSVAVMALKSNVIRFTTGLGKNVGRDGRSSGQEVARMATKGAKSNRRVFMIMPDGLTGNAADVIRGSQEILGTSFPIVGGSAGDDLQFKKTHQYYNDQVLTNSVIGVLFSGEIEIGIGARHGWRPIGKPRLVTKATSNIIMEIDNKPAISIYEDYFGTIEEKTKSKFLESLPRMTILYPLGMHISGEEEYLVRNVLDVDHDGALIYGAEVPEGSEVRLMIGNKDEVMDAAKKAAIQAVKYLGETKIKLVIIFDSAARRELLGIRANEELSLIRDVCQGAPMIGFYGYGEQAPLTAKEKLGRSYFQNETIVVLTIGEIN